MTMLTKSDERGAAATEPFNDLLGYHVRRLSFVVMSDLTESLAPLGLKPADASVLMTIAHVPGITQSELGRALGILRANMTPLIAALMARGLVEREPVDGRSQALRLSTAGRSTCRAAHKVVKDHEERLFGSLTGPARARLIARLRALWCGAA
jgi:DNA-binding MarR family transcriptional regulator